MLFGEAASQISLTRYCLRCGLRGTVAGESSWMPIINRIAEFHAEMMQWRHRIHARPETAFEEYKTAELISELLESCGIAVDRGVARRHGCAAHRRTKRLPARFARERGNAARPALRFQRRRTAAGRESYWVRLAESALAQEA